MLSNQFLDLSKRRIQKKIKERGLTNLFLLEIKRIANFKYITIYPFIIILCLIIRIIRPLFFIRFGCLYAEKIGSLAAQTEMNLCEQEHGIQQIYVNEFPHVAQQLGRLGYRDSTYSKRSRTFNIYNTGYSSFKCNSQLFKMWKRIVRVHPKSRYFWNVMNAFSFGKEHIIEPKKGTRDIYNLLERSQIHLSFTKEEIYQAQKDLLKMGINKKDKYVLMINRGQRFLDKALPGAKNMDLSYHTYRNCSINNFLPMAENLVSKGNFVIRMGYLVSDLMETKNSKIIEYDHLGFRTDLLDIYLAANCRYIVGSDTGYLKVPGWNFRKPIVHVNWSQFEYIHPWMSSWLFCFKRYWLKSEKRFMKVDEILKSGAGRFVSTKEYEKVGIELVHNTSQEIIDIVDEMELRLSGNWQDNDEDDELQRRFWDHFKISDYHGICRSRIGAKFLRENTDLI